MQTNIPPRLRALLDESDNAGAVLEFVECCDQILGQNQMPFFPAYTDHGTSHVGLVLEATERLVPDEVWQNGLLTADDSAVLVAAVFLHDLGMHLSEAGFLALVSEQSAHQPLPWFDRREAGREPDTPWPQLWQDFRRQARRLSRSQLDRILGPDAEDMPRIVLGDFDERPGDWTLDDRLIVGEFLRRHHARLAHEIAIHGMPGAPASRFPILARTAPPLAEATGATARSHHEDLRSAAAYLDTRSKGDLRPDGVVQLYLMGLLRIADYFQLDAKRATPLLLHLLDPQSPASVEEWHRHQAIVSISWDHRDPHAATVQVSPSHGLRTHIQLGDLLSGLQAELDLTAAVLSETYGSSRLSALALTLQRVKTNLHDEELHNRLRYVPRQARMRSAEDLFRLVVADLYGNEPIVAGRELLQNAVDAVRERERWEQHRGETLGEDRFRPQAADVVVEARELDPRIGMLRVSDRGIGMTVDTVVESFLTAGATFSPASMELDSDEDPTLARLKAGRFGIGIFAAYLLGDMIEVTTRHPADARGITFFAHMSEELVELRWADDAPLGTEVVAPFAFDRLSRLPPGWRHPEDASDPRVARFLDGIRRYFVLAEPEVEFKLVDADRKTLKADPALAEVPSPGDPLDDSWRSIEHPDFDALLWRLPALTIGGSSFAPWGANSSELAHNGILIRRPERGDRKAAFEWASEQTIDTVEKPSVAIFDTRHNLDLTLNRYELASSSVSFEDELLHSIGKDLVAYSLVCGEAPHPLAAYWGMKPVFTRQHWFPLVPDLLLNYMDRELCVLMVDSPEYEEITDLFLRGKTRGGKWRELPFRAALGPLDIYSDEDREDLEWNKDDAVSRDHAEKEMRRSLDNFVDLFGVWQRTGVLFRPSSPEPVTQLYGDGESPPDPLLTTIGKELYESKEDHRYIEAFALVVLEWANPYELAIEENPDFDPDTRLLEPLAAPWDEIVGGMLPRSPSARAKRGRDLCERDPELRDLVERWERLARRSRP